MATAFGVRNRTKSKLISLGKWNIKTSCNINLMLINWCLVNSRQYLKGLFAALRLTGY
jgi:hypothetical protein